MEQLGASRYDHRLSCLLIVCSDVGYWPTIKLVHVAEGICRKLPSATHGIWSWLTIWALLLREDMMMRTRQISKRCHLCPLQPLTWNLAWGKKCLREILETKATYRGMLVELVFQVDAVDALFFSRSTSTLSAVWCWHCSKCQRWL